MERLTEDEPWQRPSPHASSPPSGVRAERMVASARRAVRMLRSRPSSRAYVRRRSSSSHPHPSPQCPLRARRCVGAYRAPRSVRKRMRPIGRRRVVLCACGLGALRGRLVGQRTRGAPRVRGAGACVASCQSPPVVVGKLTTILAFSWEALFCFRLLREDLRLLRWKIHRRKRGWWNGSFSST
jgi:hypothetical protein